MSDEDAVKVVDIAKDIIPSLTVVSYWFFY